MATAYTDSDPIMGSGTPMAKPKIGQTIVDVIGGTPMVCLTRLEDRVEIIIQFHHSADSIEPSFGRFSCKYISKVGINGALQQCQR